MSTRRNGPLPRPASDRFEAMVDRSAGPAGCHPWRGFVKEGGYGSFRGGARTVGAHRAAWEFSYGDIPLGMLVCHTCDNKACVNTLHLFLGSNQDNVSDMVSKGRQARGERISSLTAPQVSEMRRRYSAGETSQSALAAEYEIEQAHVGRIVRGDAWRCLPTEPPPVTKGSGFKKAEGATHGRAKLTSEQVTRIRSDYVEEGVTYAQLAGRYGISRQTVGAIIRGSIWKCLL